MPGIVPRDCHAQVQENQLTCMPGMVPRDCHAQVQENQLTCMPRMVPRDCHAQVQENQTVCSRAHHLREVAAIHKDIAIKTISLHWN